MIYSSDIVNDVLAVSLESTTNRVFTVTIDCYDGHYLTGEVVGDATIEAKHSSGAYVDIETTSIDLSSWDGTQQTFLIRMTAGTITSHLTRAFRLRVGPNPGTVYTYVYNDDGNEIYNDDSDLVRTLA